MTMSARLPVRLLLVVLFFAAAACAQTPCASPTAWTPCDVAFELDAAEAQAHPNPYATVELEAEFRSPRFKTYRMPAFWNGGRRLLIRFTPTEAGQWDYRVTSNLARLEGRTGSFTAAAAEAPGFIRPANVHHWKYDNNQPHLWMGDTCYRFATLDRTLFNNLAEDRAARKFTHLRGLVLGWGEDARRAYPDPDRPNPAYFDELDSRIQALNSRGIIADLILAGDDNALDRLFPTWQQRQRYLRYLIARYAPMNITWQGLYEFENHTNGRELLKEAGALLKRQDPYNHPRTTHTAATTSPLHADGWMDFLAYQSSNDDLGAIEHQVFPNAQVNTGFASEDSGAGRTTPTDVDPTEFRHRLWGATMNGQYPTFANTGTAGARRGPAPEARYLDSPGARAMKAWFEFFSTTRHWELEPYFDVDGGRAVALEGVEYVVYVEKPSGPIEVLVTKHKYDIAWINPATGDRTPAEDFKGEKFVGEPPSTDHDWVLHISREGHKEGMLRSYKFDSREYPIELQVVENNSQKVPFEIIEPASDISLSQPADFAIKIKRPTRATRTMFYLWTAEVAASGQGYRVVGTGPSGKLTIPASIARDYPAILTLHLLGMNANGKVYAADRVNGLNK
jgi:hypothetical protein